MIDQSSRILLSVSTGQVSIMEATRLLGLPDAGYLFHLMAEKKLPLPRLPKEFVNEQLNSVLSAHDECLLDFSEKGSKHRKSRRRTAVA